MVCPHDEAQTTDADQRPDHRQITEHRLAGERGEHVADDTEAGQDNDVDFRVAKEPQDVLIEDRIAAAFGLEERGAESSGRSAAW